MLHPHLELRLVDPLVGYGLFATRDIPRGTITWALDPLDQVVEHARAAALPEPTRGQLDRYSWLTAHGDRILCWDFGRYMNHSCDPCSAGPGRYEFEVALRHISAGEEVTCDYGTFNLEEPMVCHCGAPECRKVVAAADFPIVAPPLDRKVRAAIPHLVRVEQPLWGLVEKWKPMLDAAVVQPTFLPSLLENQWLGPQGPRFASGAVSAHAQ